MGAVYRSLGVPLRSSRNGACRFFDNKLGDRSLILALAQQWSASPMNRATPVASKLLRIAAYLEEHRRVL